MSHFLCPPIITILPIVRKASDDFDLGALAPIIVANVCQLLRVTRELELLFSQGEEVVVYVEVVRNWLVRFILRIVRRHCDGSRSD